MPTVVDLLQRHAETRASDRAFVFIDADPAQTTTIETSQTSKINEASYAELDAAANRVAAAVSAMGAVGRPVLLLYPPGRAYVEGFLGCLYAGAIAVPAYPPDPLRLGRTLPRLRALVADCGAKLALAPSMLVDAVPALAADAPELAALEWLATDTLPADAGESWTRPELAAESLALLQYTSGSTGSPKGVLLNHANLMHNAGLVQLGFGTTPRTPGVIWLPPYHDMGLLGGIVQPIYAGLPVVLISPLTFLQRPMIWLEAISDHRAVMSGGPNFAFDLCVRKSTPEQRAALDLSSWAVAFCGAEPVRPETLDRFAAAFAVAGFRREAFYPCYGLAEGTLIVTGGLASAPPRLVDGDGAVHVGCGSALGDQQLVVADPDTGAPLPAGAVGEIWLSGPSVAQGYWNRPADTAETFGARLSGDPDRRYLRTGDLGFLDASGELVVTGRAKDLIIVRGRNVYPQDLEHAVEQGVAEVRPGCSAAFAVNLDGAERVAVVCEVAAGMDGAGGAEVDRVVAGIRQVLAETDEISPAAVVLLRPRAIPKTSSGKIQRHACARAFAGGDLVAGAADVIARWDESAGLSGTAVSHLSGSSGLLADLSHSSATETVVRALGFDPATVPPDAAVSSLGVDSLRAVDLRHTLRDEYGLDVSLSELLSGITVADLTNRITATQPDVVHLSGSSGLRADVSHSSAPTTSQLGDGERALWFVQRMAPDSTAYQITRAAWVRSDLDVEAMERALLALVRRHPALRTSLPAVQGEPVRRITDWTGPVLERHDAAGLDDGELHGRLHDSAQRRFDLATGPLFRASLFTRGPADHVLLLSLHHVICDFWSLSVMVDDLLRLYTAERAGSPADLPAMPELTPVPANAAGAGDERQLDHWRRELAGAPAALELPTTFPRPRLQSFRGRTHTFQVAPATLTGLDEVAREARATRFATLLAGYAALLARYCGEDVVIGAPTAGRDDRRSAGAMGYFVNPVPLRIRVRPGTSFRDLVAQARTTVLAALDHAVPFSRLVDAIRPVRDPSRSPVVQTMLVLQQAPPGRPGLAGFAVPELPDDGTPSGEQPVRLGELDVQPYPLDHDGSAFDLSLTLAEYGGGLTGAIEYCTDLFDHPAAGRLGRQFSALLAAAAADPDALVETYPLIDGAERVAVLTMAEGERRPLPEPTTLHATFARQVAARPDAVAITFDGRELTYAELDRRANRLAALLRDRYQVRRGGVVGVSLPRCLDLYVAFWAVLRAGGVWLPLEPNLPPGRLEWMLADARPVTVVTEATITELDQLPATAELAGPVDGGAGPDDLAWVMYTSGSTGRPKGVQVVHRGAVNVGLADGAAYGISPQSRVLQHTPYSFDAWMSEVLGTLLSGGTLVPAGQHQVAPGPALVQLLAEQRVTTVMFVPSVLAALPDAELPDVVEVSVGGEACPPDLVARWGRGRRFCNAYGPTEITVICTVGECQAGDGPRPPIGRPLPNVRTFVLDQAMRPVPVGIPGELYVGGVGVALGYLGQPGTTAERFVPDPVGPDPGARLYRTGDRVRWLPDGRLDFLGRLDDQIKIRGIRVEPDEVAARLKERLAVTEAVVLARPGPAGQPELVAYVVLPAGRDRPSVAELRALLRADLADAWLPSALVFLAALPLNSSGKLDRAALPAPAPADRGRADRIAPRTETERLVAEVWQRVLGVDAIGVRDHFFDQLGGSSLLVAKVTSALGDRLGREVPVTHLFEHPTVEALARRLRPEPEPAAPDPDPGRTGRPEDVAAARRRAIASRRLAGR